MMWIFDQQFRGGVVLNYDDNPDRRYSEFCMRTGKAILNPIIDWDEEDVWQFLNQNDIPHCCLYDEGFTRLGCIGCPMGRAKKQKQEFERWPKYRVLYMKAFKRMLEERARKGLDLSWKDENDVMNWWLGGEE